MQKKSPVNSELFLINIGIGNEQSSRGATNLRELSTQEVFERKNNPRKQILRLFNKYRNRQRPIFPGGYPPSIVGARSLYDRVRDGNGWCPSALSPINLLVTYTGSCIIINLITLFLSPVSKCRKLIVSAIFHILRLIRKFWQKNKFCSKFFSLRFRKSPRPISNARLRLLPNFHLHPINVVFCDGTY